MTRALARLTLFNMAGAAGLIWAWSHGYVQQVFNGDVSGISYVIAAVFAVALVGTYRGKTAILTDVAEWLVTLGLIANVIGFVLALSGVDASAIGSADAASKVAAPLLEGMGTAFYGTLTGAICALWTSINKRIAEAA